MEVGELQGDDHQTVFEVVEKLGAGSYGTVWKAQARKDSSKLFAAKRVVIESASDLGTLRKEIDFMASCRSPYIVRYFGSFVESTVLWILMEYCSGGSVSDLMKVCDTTLDELQISTVIKFVAKALHFLHGSHKIHRDIKAGNILMNSAGVCKLADFGVSGQLADTMAKRYTVVGTPYWMGPEVILDAGYNEKADIWSLGITCIEMAQGRPPYSDMHPMRAIFMIPSRNPPTLEEPKLWSGHFNDFLTKCLVKVAEQRSSAKDLLEHPFLAKAPETGECLLPLLQKQEARIKAVGREKALGIEMQQTTQEMTRSLCATGAKYDPADDETDSGTIVVH